MWSVVLQCEDSRHSVTAVSRIMLTFGVFVTECGGSHVTQTQGALAAAVHEQVAVMRVELSRCDHLGQILHIGWFDVHDI